LDCRLPEFACGKPKKYGCLKWILLCDKLTAIEAIYEDVLISETIRFQALSAGTGAENA